MSCISRPLDAIFSRGHLLQFPRVRGPREESVADPLTVTRHVRFGWWSLALFATLGLVLETLHGFKIGLYLDASNDTRRLMWTLAHAHGTLLSLVHLIFALTVKTLGIAPARLGASSPALVVASVCLPGGFFLGGVQIYSGDPGIGVALVPIGAVLTIYAAVVIARAISTASAPAKS